MRAGRTDQCAGVAGLRCASVVGLRAAGSEVVVGRSDPRRGIRGGPVVSAGTTTWVGRKSILSHMVAPGGSIFISHCQLPPPPSPPPTPRSPVAPLHTRPPRVANSAAATSIGTVDVAATTPSLPLPVATPPQPMPPPSVQSGQAGRLAETPAAAPANSRGGPAQSTRGRIGYNRHGRTTNNQRPPPDDAGDVHWAAAAAVPCYSWTATWLRSPRSVPVLDVGRRASLAINGMEKWVEGLTWRETCPRPAPSTHI